MTSIAVLICGCLLGTMIVVLLRMFFAKKERAIGNGIVVTRINTISKPLTMTLNPYLEKSKKGEEEEEEEIEIPGVYVPVSGMRSNELADV